MEWSGVEWSGMECKVMQCMYNIYIYICSLDISKPFEFLWSPFFFRITSLETYSTEGCHGRTGRTCPWKLCNSSRTAVGDLGCWKVYSSRWKVASQEFLHVVYDAIKRFAKKNLSQNITQYYQFAAILVGLYPIFRRQRCMKPIHGSASLQGYHPFLLPQEN